MNLGRSPVFEAMFRSEMLEQQTGVVELDLSSKTLKILLHFIYTGSLPQGWSKDDYIDVIGLELDYAADKYMLDELSEILKITFA